MIVNKSAFKLVALPNKTSTSACVSCFSNDAKTSAYRATKCVFIIFLSIIIGRSRPSYELELDFQFLY